MKKNIEWLKEEIGELPCVDTVFNSEGSSYIDSAVPVMVVYDLIDKLDEPEVLSQEENINIVLNDLKEYIKEQQSLSQNVGLAHTSAGNDTHYRQYDYALECIDEYEPSDDLENLIVPKQEIAEEQVMDWLDKNDFYDHITAETVLERAVDKGELNYYGTKYSVIKTPTIPQFVVDWHKQNKYYLLSAKFERIADWEDERVVNWYEKCTGRHSNNLANAQETIALMDLVGYEVEEEPKYYVNLGTAAYVAKRDGDNQVDIYTADISGNDEFEFHLTEQEIKDYDERYWAFAKPVEEMEE